MLADLVLVGEAEVVEDPDLTAPDVAMLEERELELDIEVGSDVVDDLLLGITETVGDIDLVEAADGFCADELGTPIEAVLVCCSPTTPMIVCAIPSETWKVPFPVLQSHFPSALSG